MICVTLNGNTQQSTAYTYTAHKLTGTTLTDTANAQTVATAYTYDTRGNLTGQTVTTTPNNGAQNILHTFTFISYTKTYLAHVYTEHSCARRIKTKKTDLK